MPRWPKIDKESYLVPIEELREEEKQEPYVASDREQAVLWYIEKRFKAMQSARSVADKDWNIYQQMIDAIFEPYPDERSSSTVPLASAIIELFVAETLKLKPDFRFRADSSKYAQQARALEFVWKYDWRKNKRDKALNENEYTTAWFGTSVIYVWHESYTKSQFDMIVWDDNNITWEKKEIPVSNILLDNIDIRQFWIDDQVIDDVSQASDAIYRQWISFEKFANCCNGEWYKNTEYVSPRWYSAEYNTFITKWQESKTGKYVLFQHYWNIDKDMYVITANDIVIRETPVPNTIDWVKAIPFAVRVLGKKNYSIRWRGMCETLMMFNSEVNDLRELIMDWIRRSNTQTLAIWTWLTFKGRSFNYDNEILSFDWQFGGNFQQISGNPPNNAIFQYMQEIYKSIAIYCGIDVQNIIWQPQQTAFQTEVQREASQKRVNVWLFNRNIAYERVADLYKDQLQTNFAKKDADDLYPEIEVEWVAVTQDDKGIKFKDKKNKVSTFQVTPETLRWKVYIDVFTNTTAPTINAVQKAEQMEFMKSMNEFVTTYAQAQQMWIDLEKVLPMKETIRKMAEDHNLPVESNPKKEDVKEAKDKLVSDMQQMLTGWVPKWSTAEQPLPANQQPQQWQPIASTWS